MERISRVTLSSAFVGLGVALGYLFAFIPNVEVISFVAFSSGVILGWRRGTFTAGLMFLIFAVLNPFGVSPFPLLITQIIGGSIFGLLGGILRYWLIDRADSKALMLLSGLAGVLLTLLYDLLTNLGAYITIGSPGPLWIFLGAGVTLSLVHVISNALIFGLLSPTWKRINKLFPSGFTLP